MIILRLYLLHNVSLLYVKKYVLLIQIIYFYEIFHFHTRKMQCTLFVDYFDKKKTRIRTSVRRLGCVRGSVLLLIALETGEKGTSSDLLQATLLHGAGSVINTRVKILLDNESPLYVLRGSSSLAPFAARQRRASVRMQCTEYRRVKSNND